MRPRPRRPLVLRLIAPAAAAAVLLLAGCSGGAADDAAPSTAAVGASPVSASASASPGASASTLPPTSTVTSMTTFRSPTGNITCYLAPVEGATPFARCDLAEVTWDQAPPATGCAGTWGGAGGKGVVGVGGGEAQVLCAGDTVVDAAAALELPYGSSITMGPLTCTSTETGMDCENAETEHGFVVRKDAFKPR